MNERLNDVTPNWMLLDISTRQGKKIDFTINLLKLYLFFGLKTPIDLLQKKIII